MQVETATAFRTCPLCEATCGLSLKLTNGAVTRIRGDRDDVFSAGFLCPKGTALHHLHNDPDRLTQPMIKRGDRHLPVPWDEAWAAVDAGLDQVIERHGRSALAAYGGNPNAHNLGAMLFLRPLLKAFGTPNIYTAATVDQRPKEISAGLMFGSPSAIPIPDIDRTDALLILGANPFESNGSLATAPDWPGRLTSLVERGGQLIVVDPCRTRTAEAATEYLAVRPGTDPLLLAALIDELFQRGRVDPQLGTVGEYAKGLDRLQAAVMPFSAEVVGSRCGIMADTIRRVAAALADAKTAVVYGRMGTTTSPLGTVGSWLIDALNICLGTFDQPGGAMFSTPAAGSATTRGTPRFGSGTTIARHRSRVGNLPESFGELPVAALADEILTSGDGQIRALVTIAGNPVLSNPDANRLDAALAELDFMVAVDIYLNETTRHANVILPVPSALEKSHYDIALYSLALRNVANFSPAVLERPIGTPDEWEVLAKLAAIASGLGANADPAVIDEQLLQSMVTSAGLDLDETIAALGERRGPERMLDLMLRIGPYGDRFGAVSDGLTLDVLIDHPHGIDFGPLQPRVPDVLRQPDGMIDLAPAALIADLANRGTAMLTEVERAGGLTLIGRRQLRSNNSWMHNVRVLVKGKPRCTLQIHPDDAARVGLANGDLAEVRSAVGALEIVAEVTDAISPGVVSIPHGWGHSYDGAQLAVAAERAGVNSNALTDPNLLDAVSGTSVLNGIPIEVRPAWPRRPPDNAPYPLGP